MVPRPALAALARYSFDWYLMSEDLPNPDSRSASMARASFWTGAAATRPGIAGSSTG